MSSLVLILLLLAAAATAGPTDYCKIQTCVTQANHTMCLYPNDGASSSCSTVKERGVTADDQAKILQAHNSIRQDVKKGEYDDKNLPAAQAMPDLTWDDELATVAQRWADQCREVYGDHCRDVPRFFVGQSITSEEGPNKNKNWTDIVANAWFADELPEFTQNDLIFRGGFTSRLSQTIWADTNKIGCGFIRVESANPVPAGRTVRTYICNYGPGGNKLNFPIYQKKP